MMTLLLRYCVCHIRPKQHVSLQWRHNECDVVSNQQPHDCLLNRLFRRRSKKISKLRVTGLCAGNSPVTGELPEQMTSNVENVSTWWRHHACWDRSYGMTLCVHPLVCPCGLLVSKITKLHDDVIKWKHVPRYWPFVRGIHLSPVNFPTKVSDAELWCFLWSAPE